MQNARKFEVHGFKEVRVIQWNSRICRNTLNLSARHNGAILKTKALLKVIYVDPHKRT